MKFYTAISWLIVLGLISIARAEHITARIFIHGTIMPGLGLLSAKSVYTRTLADSHWYSRFMLQKVSELSQEHSRLRLDIGLASEDLCGRIYTGTRYASRDASAKYAHGRT